MKKKHLLFKKFKRLKQRGRGVKLLFIGLITLVLFLGLNNQIMAQGVSINETGNDPDASAALDVSSSSQGILFPRLTTAERDAIVSPAESLFIFNTTTQCFEAYNSNTSTWISFGCIGCIPPTAVTATASANLICEGGSLTLTGSATDATSWNWFGPNGFISSDQNPTITNITAAGSGVYTLTASNNCASVNASTASVTVSAINTVSAASSTPTLDMNTALTNITHNTTGATGIGAATDLPAGVTATWSANVITISGTPTVSGVFNYNIPLIGGCGSVNATGTITVNYVFPCGAPLAITHTVGAVAPVTKTVNYGTVTTNLSGSNKCWITQNLGADNQAASANDGTEASAGWYWQFNRKQGYKHDGITRTPATTWITSIDETSDWVTANDPCTIELGTGWRIPTYTEWFNADANGGWIDYDNDATGTYGSVLKLHAAGYLENSSGSLWSCGAAGDYWSSKQSSSVYGWFFRFGIANCEMNDFYKTYAFSLRCLHD